jgi:hypothetical protein
VRQVGLVIGTAAVGALLQNRLVSTLISQARSRSAALPPQVRGRFVTEIHRSASSGIQVGAGQNGGVTSQAGLPAKVAAEVARIGHDVFVYGYVEAMRSTMLLPVILLGVGAVSCLALKRRAAKPGAQPGSPAEAGVPAAAEARTPDQAGLA